MAGAPRKDVFTRRSLSGTHDVWVLQAQSDLWIQKRFRSAPAYRGERDALERWDPERVLGHDDDALTLHLRWIPGGNAPTEPPAHAAAARWLRRLHAMPLDAQDPLPLDVAFERRIDALSAEGGPWATELLGPVDPKVLAGPRVFCHRDFTPSNWIWDGRTFDAIDFEHARPDHPLVDVVKLAAEVWPEHPALEAAFREAWGPIDARALDALLRVNAVRTLCWGRRRNDPTYIALGERLVAAIRS